MKHLLTLLAALAAFVTAGGCSTMTPMELPPATLQQMILEDGIIEPGETVKLVSVDGRVHKFRVLEVDTRNAVIIGRKNTVPIPDVIALETKNLSAGKTALLAAGVYSVIYLIAIAIAPAVILSGG
jgi:hypothetical protein